MSDLTGRVALVTGGGRGIGRAHSHLLASRGAAVLVCDLGVALDGSGRDLTVAEAVAEEIRLAGGTADAATVDISSFAGGQQAVQAALDAFGRVDIVVNNAGIAGGAPIDSVEEEMLDTVFAVNFIGTVGVTRAAWPHLRAARSGRVVNTVSEVAFDSKMASQSTLGYGAAKAAVWSATLSLAREGLPHGITVNAVSPGARTRMNEAMFAAAAPPPGLDLDPLHVARLVGWLVSDEAADVTGRIVHAAGGQLREYRTQRYGDTDLIARISTALSQG